MTIDLHAVTLDCTNAARLATFWAAALDRKVDADPTDEFASIGLGEETSGRPAWMFIQVPEPKQGKNRMHVDLASGQAAAEIDRLLALGASRVADLDEDGTRWTTLADPEGNEFDLIHGT